MTNLADELERLAKEATPGRWQNGIEDLEGVVAPDNPGLGNVVCLPPNKRMYSSSDFWPANAALIVALRNALPEIISALRREEWQGPVSFLLERLDDFEQGIEGEDDARQYHGHVAPAKARVRSLLPTKGTDHE